MADLLTSENQLVGEMAHSLLNGWVMECIGLRIASNEIVAGMLDDANTTLY
jgi:hypothetical protein